MGGSGSQPWSRAAGTVVLVVVAPRPPRHRSPLPTSACPLNAAAAEKIRKRGAAREGSSPAGLLSPILRSVAGAAAARTSQGRAERPARGTDGTGALHQGCALLGASDSPVHRGRCLFFMSYLRCSLWEFSFFFLSEPHKIAFCSTEINSVYVRETFPATVGFALNPVSCC